MRPGSLLDTLLASLLLAFAIGAPFLIYFWNI